MEITICSLYHTTIVKSSIPRLHFSLLIDSFVFLFFYPDLAPLPISLSLSLSPISACWSRDHRSPHHCTAPWYTLIILARGDRGRVSTGEAGQQSRKEGGRDGGRVSITERVDGRREEEKSGKKGAMEEEEKLVTVGVKFQNSSTSVKQTFLHVMYVKLTNQL